MENSDWCWCGLAHSHFFTSPADSPSPSPPVPHTMSLLASILGFSAFGFGARCLQLGLQKRPIFDGEPRPPAPPLTPPLAFHGHAYAVIGFGMLGAGAYHVDQKQCVAATVRGGELTGSAAGLSCSQRRRRPCSSSGRLRAGNGLRTRGKRTPCSSLGCSVYQLAPRVFAQLTNTTHHSPLRPQLRHSHAHPPLPPPPRPRPTPRPPSLNTCPPLQVSRQSDSTCPGSPFILWPPRPPGSNVPFTISKASLTTMSVPPRESHASRTRRKPSQIPRSFL